MGCRLDIVIMLSVTISYIILCFILCLFKLQCHLAHDHKSVSNQQSKNQSDETMYVRGVKHPAWNIISHDNQDFV